MLLSALAGVLNRRCHPAPTGHGRPLRRPLGLDMAARYHQARPTTVGVVSWIERSVEERLAKAAANGELRVPELEGKPLADLDQPRNSGWWADQFGPTSRSMPPT